MRRRPLTTVLAVLAALLSFAQAQVCFTDTATLRGAIQTYRLLPANASDSPIGQLYGWPINNWCVDQIQDFSSLFIGAVDFNEPLNGWNVSNALTMQDMFAYASTFNQE